MLKSSTLSFFALTLALVHCSGAAADSDNGDSPGDSPSDNGAATSNDDLKKHDAGVKDAQADAKASSDAGKAHDAGGGPSPTDAGPLPDAPLVRLAVGNGHTCAILDSGALKCWGVGDYGALGLGDKQTRGDQPGEMGASLPAVNLGAGRTALSVATGSIFTCALLDDHAIKCWGNNAVGQLGLGDKNDRGDQPGEMGDALPSVDLGPGRTAVSVVCGGAHACAILDDETVKCWGYNASGQLGLGDSQHRGDQPNEMGAALPTVDLGPGRTAKALTAGDRNTCARLDDGTLKCWGGQDGALGLGDNVARGISPGQMGASLPVVDLGVGARVLDVSSVAFSSVGVLDASHSCVVLDGGAVKCWGHNYNGELGIGNTDAHGEGPNEMGAHLPAVNLGTGKTAVEVVAGGAFSCAILNDGHVKCWGYNKSGQLGVGDAVARGAKASDMGNALPAVDLGIGRTAKHIAANLDVACALLDDDSIRCWGENSSGELGLGDKIDRGSQPGQMGDALPVVNLQ